MKEKFTKGIRALSFVAILSAAFFGITCIPQGETLPNENKPIVQQTNIVHQATTNQQERSEKPTNLNWFTDSSNYIWDGWKIK